MNIILEKWDTLARTLYKIESISFIVWKIDDFLHDFIKADFNTPYWRWRFFHSLETDYDLENRYNHNIIQWNWKTLWDIIKEWLKWKSWDLKNWFNSLSISNFPIKEDDLKIKVSKEWDWLKVYKKWLEVILIKII